MKSLRPHSILLATVLAATACAPAIQPGIASGPATVSLDEDDIGAIAALLRMEDARRLDVDLVSRLVDHPHAEVRGRVALAAGRVRDSRANPILLRALRDPAEDVRTRAAFSLGIAGDTSAAVIDALTRTALEDAPDPAAEAVAALGRTGVETARRAVDSILAGDGAPVTVRHSALLAAWRLPRQPGTVAAVARWIAHADPQTRWRAVYALMRAGGAAGVPDLLNALRDDDDLVRATAARGLRAPAADSAGMRDAALTALLAAASDTHPHVRINALRALASYDDAPDASASLVAALLDADANVAVAAAEGLAQNPDPRTSTALAAVARDEARPTGLRAVALGAWATVDAGPAATLAGQWADSTRWLMRYHAARALRAAPWSASGETLRRLTRDRHPVVAAAALDAVRTSADTITDARALFIEGLGSGHVLIRAAAARGIGHAAGPADLDLLLQAYNQALGDTLPDASVAVVEALGDIADRGLPVRNAFFLRFGGPGPPASPAVHRAIAARLGPLPDGWEEPAVAPQPRSLAFYTDIVRRFVAAPLGGEPLPRAAIVTDAGEIVLELAAPHAPLTVHNFLSLAERGYFRQMRWHRVVPNFVIQDGDPRGDGLGGPGYAIRDEINPLRYLRGVVGMALSGPDTGGSQYFITHSPQPHLDGGYTVFGRVLSGMDVVDRVVQEDAIHSVDGTP
ncbi:MAG TPA: peptidylprolyl isomerase [Longimicrobiales bacterium]|nr:peptidylprolyl isomerase [Longimicrobiales bacterium]